MDGIQMLERLGWEWHPTGIGQGTGPGVMIKAQVAGRGLMQVFIPLSRVWLSFDQELQRVGCPSAASVGAPFSVGGFFDFVKKAAKSVVHRVVPKAIQRAASKVVATAKKYGALAAKGAKAIGTNPVFRGAMIAASFAIPALAPAAAALEIANRAMQAYKLGMNAAKAIKQGVHTAENVAAVAKGLTARNQLQAVIQRAHAGDPRARQVVGAFQQRMAQGARQSAAGTAALRQAANTARQLSSRPQFAQAAHALQSFF